jgi:hypothetical protein
MHRLKGQASAWAISVALCSGAAAQVRTNSPNPYQVIAQRNLFGLKAPSLLKPNRTVAVTPEIILTGLTTITGRKLALLKLKFPQKAVQQQKEESCILKEGEQNGSVRILQIDMKAESVKVNNSGNIMVLTFQRNGPKPTISSPQNVGPAFTLRPRR